MPTSTNAAAAKKIRPVVTIREARFEDDRDAIIGFEQALALETEGKTLDHASIKRGVELPLTTRHLARLFVACLPFKKGAEGKDELMTPDEYNEIDDVASQEACLKSVGFMAIGQQWSTTEGGFFNFILSVFIEAPFRGCGIFKKLYKYVENTVQRDRLSIGLRLYVDKDNEAAQKTYERLGMTNEKWNMWNWKKPKELLPAHCGEEVPPPEPLNLPNQYPEKYPWKIRLAEAADLPELVSLEIEHAKETLVEGHLPSGKAAHQRSSSLIASKDSESSEVDQSSIRRGLAMAWSNPELARVYVAEMIEKVPSDKPGGYFNVSRIVGMVTVSNEYSEWNAGVVAWLTSIYIIPPLRKHGVFTSLFNFAKSEVERDPNVIGIRMLTVPGNPVQEKLAKKIGLTLENYNLMASMDPNARKPLTEQSLGAAAVSGATPNTAAPGSAGGMVVQPTQ